MNDNKYILRTIGMVTGIMDGITSVIGLGDVKFNETVYIHTGGSTPVIGLVLNLSSTMCQLIILRGEEEVLPGQFVSRSNVLMGVSVSASLLGRIVDPTGMPLDEGGSLDSGSLHLLETLAPSIISRSPVNLPLETGLKVVDSMIPIGHGQRELSSVILKQVKLLLL